MSELKPCTRCDGGGEVANTDDGEPWTAWTSLPPGSDMAVRMGLVRPLPCPECNGSGSARTSPAGSGHGRVDTGELRVLLDNMYRRSNVERARILRAAADELDAAREREQALSEMADEMHAEATRSDGVPNYALVGAAVALRRALDGNS